MPVQLIDAGGDALKISTQGALRAATYPIDHQTRGHYRAFLKSSSVTAGLGAGSDVFGWAWLASTPICVITSIRLASLTVSTGFAAGDIDLELLRHQGFTAITLGTDLRALMTSADMRMRSTHAEAAAISVANSDITVTSGSALTVTSSSTDAIPIGGFYSRALTAAGNQITEPYPLFDTANGEHPLILLQNEGFTLNATVPATGVWRFALEVHWTEVDDY